MNEPYQSLAHCKWNCKYHVVFIPKGRKKVVFGQIRKPLGPILHELAKECRIVEGPLMADHVHMCIEIPPKHSVASVIEGQERHRHCSPVCGQAAQLHG